MMEGLLKNEVSEFGSGSSGSSGMGVIECRSEPPFTRAGGQDDGS